VLSWFRSRAQDRRTAVDLYGAIVTQARRPEFFDRDGVLDTPEGRTAMIILLMFPVLERLTAEGRRGRRIARLLSETFVVDIDDCLREMGVGDMSVPRKVKRAAQALGERCGVYRSAANAPEPVGALAAELAQTVPGLEANARAASALARYALGTRAGFLASPAGNLLEGRAVFPDPATVLVSTAQQ
jgi:cytochrome b pre-mRNA-processing protein 3